MAGDVKPEPKLEPSTPPKKKEPIRVSNPSTRLGYQPDGTYHIHNVYPVGPIPTFYYQDPDPEMKNLGPTPVPDFKSIDDWIPGMPHKNAFPIEKEHNYDWSEFSGVHRHPEVDSLEYALKQKSAGWCFQNLECAQVFQDLSEMRPCIFPSHSDYPKFRQRFESAYWDLILTVPGLGDNGRVLGSPFGGNMTQIKILADHYEENNDLTDMYGLNNPPSPEKVCYEIIRYGSNQMMGFIREVAHKYPQVKIHINSKVNLFDILLQCWTCPIVIEGEHLSEELVDSAKFQLKDLYGLNFATDKYEDEEDDDEDEDEEDDEDELDEAIEESIFGADD